MLDAARALRDLVQMNILPNSEDQILDGLATGVVSLIVENFTEQVSYHDDGPGIGSVQCQRKLTESKSYMSTEHHIDSPFDTHIPPGQGPRLYAVLPVLCIADELNICSLFTCTPCRRMGHFTTTQVNLTWLEARPNEK